MNKLFTKIASLTLGLAMVVGVGVAVGSAKASEAHADSVTLEIKSSVTENTTIKDGGNNSWSVTSDGDYNGNTAYIQVGTNSKSVSYLRLETDAFSNYTISQVQVWATSKANTKVTPKVYIGETLIGEGPTYTSQTASAGGTEYDAINSNAVTGSLKIEISRETSSTGAIYFNKAIVIYSSGPTPVETHSVIFNANGDGVTGMPDNLTNKVGNVSLDNVAQPAREGYVFKGWSLTSTGEVVSVVNVDSADVNVYAIWEIYVPNSSLVFTAACGGSGTADDGKSWTVTSDANESTFDSTRGIHYGTNSAAVSYLKLNTSDFKDVTITKVVVHASAGSSATVDVKVGGSAFGGAAQTLASADAEYTFTGSADAAEIEVNIAKPEAAVKALYCKSVVVYYDDGGEPPVPVTKYTVTDSVEHGSLNVKEVEEGATLSAKITPESGYTLPESVSVTMGGQQTQFTYVNGVVTVANVTGNIVISGTCPAIPAGDLPNGDYEAILTYSNPIATAVAITKSGTQTGSSLVVSNDGAQLDTSHSQITLAKDKSLTFTNSTNAVFTKVDVTVYRFDEFNLFVDDSTTAAHTGDNSSGDNSRLISVDVSGSKSIKIVGNGGSTGAYSQSIISVKLYLKVGSDPVPVTGVELNANSGKLFIGYTRQLTATVLPSNADNKNVTWSSSDENVATVSATGLVTCKNKGPVTITVTTVDGGFKATFVAEAVPLSYGSEQEPLSVEDAREVLDITGSNVSAEKLYVKGVVSASKFNENDDVTKQDYTIWLKSSDGKTAKYFEFYQALINNPITEDDKQTDALKGIEVVGYGYGKIYNGTYELCKANDEKPVVSKYAEPAEQYLVTFAENGKYFPDMYDAGEQITIANYHEELVPDGKSFDHWEDEQKVSYQPGDKYTVNGAVTFTAVYVDSDWSSSFKSAFQEKFNVSYPPYINAEFAKEENIVFAENEKLCTISVSGDHVNEVKAKYVNWTSLGKTNDGQDLYKHPTADLYMSVSYVQETVVKFQVKKGAILDASSVKKDFYVGDSIDTTGLKVFYTLVDGSYSENLPVSENSWSASPSKFNTAGNVDVTVTVTGLASPVELKYQVVVLAVQVAKIEISGAMIKTSYTTEDDWNPNGFIVLATYNNGSQEYVTSNVQWSYSPEKPTAGVKLVTATASFGGASASKDTAVTIYEVYKAENFAEDFLALVAPICNNYDGKTSNKEALKSVWYTMAERYNVLDNDEKVKVIKSASKVDGTALERAMAFYDYACKKYGLKPFVENRTINSLVFETQTTNSILPIIVIVVASLAAVTSIGLIIAYKRRKNLYMK